MERIKGYIALTVLLLVILWFPLKFIFPVIWQGNESLYVAIKEEDVSRVRALLDEGPDPNSTSRGFLWLLSEDEDFSYPYPPLFSAIRKNRPDIVRLLLDKGADINWQKRKNGATPLLTAVREKQPEMVKLLIEQGANINLSYPLFEAIDGGQVEMVRILLQHGANASVIAEDGGTVFRDTHPFAPNGIPRTGNREIIEMLKQAGAKEQAH